MGGERVDRGDDLAMRVAKVRPPRRSGGGARRFSNAVLKPISAALERLGAGGVRRARRRGACARVDGARSASRPGAAAAAPRVMLRRVEAAARQSRSARPPRDRDAGDYRGIAQGQDDR